MNFDLEAELKKLNDETKLNRQVRYSRSRLDKYKGELLLLHRSNVSVAELQRWLRSKRVKVHWSTVSRWIKKHG
jgi:transposase-like protein